MDDPDLIERLTRDAGGERVGQPGDGVLVCFHPEDLRRFAALVAEECAKLADATATCHELRGSMNATTAAEEIARTIRATFKAPG